MLGLVSAGLMLLGVGDVLDRLLQLLVLVLGLCAVSASAWVRTGLGFRNGSRLAPVCLSEILIADSPCAMTFSACFVGSDEPKTMSGRWCRVKGGARMLIRRLKSYITGVASHSPERGVAGSNRRQSPS